MTKITVAKDMIEQAIEALTDKCGGRCNAEYNPCHALEVATTLRAALAKPVETMCGSLLEPLRILDQVYDQADAEHVLQS